MKEICIFIFINFLSCILANNYPSYAGPPYLYNSGGEATGTHYDYPQNGNCGYGNLFGRLGPHTNNIVAVNTHLFNSTLQCGQCYDLFINNKTLTVIVTDQCPDPGWCDSHHTHFDLYKPAFELLQDPNILGTMSNITFKKVPCPIQGNIHVYLKPGYSQYYQSILIFNHTIGIESVDILKENTTQYTPMRRTFDNHWEPVVWGNPGNSYKLRINSVLGESVVAIIDQPCSDKLYDSGAQFSRIPGPTDGINPFYSMDTTSSANTQPTYSITHIVLLFLLFLYF
ncbi:expansin-like protein [Heterostelium album PN500]|uniref:Expansin-like protein n=1 Tax=Heterostelium pallidum (strain ATCC 26659 / Pp 5 / PN500) TaxID=670386 RepID=D3BUE4_HETP5|nr:expansin-like protein [Heterostelium album PN500]EFA74732.1 expansin-like protein [Heterostelium album PN500]|eukprot:XP_020426866.1 expansin-like protein [Heterostelium album PN500]